MSKPRPLIPFIEHPEPVDDEQAGLYRLLLGAHCDQGHKDGVGCQGAMTIRNNSVTLRCPLCGGCRAPIATN